MLRDRRVIGHFLRGATLALVVAAAGASAWLACDSDGASTGQSGLDRGPTYGLEVVVSVRGRGRVVSVPAAIDCPTTCFARVVLGDPTIDGSAEGLQLGAEENIGSHFVGWTFESVSLGVAARGPSQCSPMKRWTSVLAPTAGAHAQTLAFGETEGTPPPGLEAECAPYTRVPVAYAITAVFEENDVRPRPPPPPGLPVEVVFEPPALGVTVGKEIAVIDGKVYWRFNRGKDTDLSAPSGIAMGKADGTGGGSTLIVPPNDRIGRVLFGPTTILQHASGLAETISTATNARFQFYLPSPCLGLAIDATTGYCRVANGATTYLVTWPLGTSAYNYIYQMPGGYEIAVDGPDLYFSEEQTGGAEGLGAVDRGPRVNEAGCCPFPVTTKLVVDQSSPRDLVLNDTHMFWIDRNGSTTTMMSAAKNDAGANQPGLQGTTFAVDPSGDFYVAQAGDELTGWSILRASATSPTVEGFRYGLRPIGGIAVDATHVYWTGGDGRVYRAPKL